MDGIPAPRSLTSQYSKADGPFPLKTEDKTVKALLAAGHDQLAHKLSYELHAQGGNSLTARFSGYSAERVSTATKRIAQMREEAAELLADSAMKPAGQQPKP